MKLDRVLLTTDLSDESLRAFKPLAELVRERGSTLLLLHVVEDVALIPRGAPFAASLHLPGAAEDQKRAESWLAEHAQGALGGIPITLHVVRSDNAAEAIAGFAEEHAIDLIAMATHGRSGFRAMLVGSVAAAVLRHAHCPVLVFPRKA
jgi:nucleotide-binding universal stress UspA family protein